MSIVFFSQTVELSQSVAAGQIEKVLADLQTRIQDDPVILVLVILILVCIVGIIAAALASIVRKTSRAGGGLDRRFDDLTRVRGKLERIEQVLNELKTDAVRGQEFNKVEFQIVRDELVEIKALISQPSRRATGELPVRPAAGPPGGGPAEEPQQQQRHSTFDEIVPSAAAWKASDFQKPADTGWRIDRKDAAAAEELAAGAPESLARRLAKTRTSFLGKLKELFATRATVDEALLEELEASLIFADLGARMAQGLVNDLRRELKAGHAVDQAAVQRVLKQKLQTIMEEESGEPAAPQRQPDGPAVILLVGVNGSGKTTTAAKLARRWKNAGRTVMLAAADTFRAAAVEQLQQWGKELGIPVAVGAENAKPATVVFDALERAASEGIDVLVIDTAGRLHTKANLMQELEGVLNVIKRKQPAAPHETWLVIDGSTGQNALAQAREFNAAVPLTGLAVTKLDGTAKGGIVVAVKSELGVPVRFIGVGEGPDDLRPFQAAEFAAALLEEGEDGGARRGRRGRRDTTWNI